MFRPRTLSPRLLVAFACLVFLFVASPAARAQQATHDYSLVDLVRPVGDESLKIARVEAEGANVDAETLRAVLTREGDLADIGRLLSGLTARRLALRDIQYYGKDGTIVVVGGLELRDVVSGRIGAATLTDTAFVVEAVKVDLGAVALAGIVWDEIAAFIDTPDTAAVPRHDRAEARGVKVAFTTGGTIGRHDTFVTLARLSLENRIEGTLSVWSRALLEGFSIAGEGDSLVAERLKAAGIERLEADAKGDFVYDKNAKRMALEGFTLKTTPGGTLSLDWTLADAGPDMVDLAATSEAIQAAILASSLVSIDLRFQDAGLLDKAIAFMAAYEDKKPEQIRSLWRLQARNALPLAFGGHPLGRALGDALSRFVEKPGTLAVAVRAKGGALPIPRMMELGEPRAILEQLDVTITADP